MGIRGLTGWIKWAADPSIKEPNWAQWKGKKIGVDILGFLYKAKAQHYSPILYLGRLIAAFKKYDIIPVPIFDGKPPDEKREALKMRSELRIRSDTLKVELKKDLDSSTLSETQRLIAESELRVLEQNTSYLTSDERALAKQLFYACGITALNAAGEADNVLAYFSRREELAAIISNDLDLLPRGVQTLLVPDNYALPGDKSGWVEYNLTAILEHAQLSYPQFVEMCVLMGCDYTAGLKSFPYKAAYWAIRYRGDMCATLRHFQIQSTEPYTKATEILKGVSETQESLMGEKQWEKWATPGHTLETEALAEFRKSYLADLPLTEYELLCNSVI